MMAVMEAKTYTDNTASTTYNNAIAAANKTATEYAMKAAWDAENNAKTFASNEAKTKADAALSMANAHSESIVAANSTARESLQWQLPDINVASPSSSSSSPTGAYWSTCSNITLQLYPPHPFPTYHCRHSPVTCTTPRAVLAHIQDVHTKLNILTMNTTDQFSAMNVTQYLAEDERAQLSTRIENVENRVAKLEGEVCTGLGHGFGWFGGGPGRRLQGNDSRVKRACACPPPTSLTPAASIPLRMPVDARAQARLWRAHVQDLR